jgi:hypothetical protein
MRPVEAVQRFEFAEARSARSTREVGALSFASFQCDERFDSFGRTQSTLVSMGQEGAERVVARTKAELRKLHV